MVKYMGYRDEAGTARVVRSNGSDLFDLPMCNELRNHSPDGPEWGYGGSGPAQLALALLVDVLGATIALSCYQEFKWDVVARLNRQTWTLRADDVRAWWTALDKTAKDVLTASGAPSSNDGAGDDLVDLHEPL